MPRRKPSHVFLNVPFDDEYEPLYVALIAALTAFELTPRTVLEIPAHDAARVGRLRTLIASCGASIHDLSRVTLSGDVPRFNMPFELGLSLGIHTVGALHKWFVFESTRHRLTRSLSDMNGHDVEIHENSVDGILRAVRNSFPTLRPLLQHDELSALWKALADDVPRIKAQCGPSLFTPTAFLALVAKGQSEAAEYFASVISKNRTAVEPAEPYSWEYIFRSVAFRNRIDVPEAEIKEVAADVVAAEGVCTPRALDLMLKIKGPTWELGTIYCADVNNDGRLEYVLCDQHMTGFHNNWIAGIFRVDTVWLHRIELPAHCGFARPKSVYHFARPFLTITPNGVVLMNFIEGLGGKTERVAYVWEKGRVREVERAYVTRPFA